MRLVVDCKFAVILVNHRRCIELHWVVVLDRRVVFGFVAYWCRGKCLLRRPARLRWREQGLKGVCGGFDGDSLLALAVHVGDVWLLLVLDPD